MIATAAPHPVAEALGARLGAASVLCSRFAIEGGYFTGELQGVALLGQCKADSAASYAARAGASLLDAYAYCDDFEDRHLLARVGHPVVVRPERRLRALARASGWPELAADAADHSANVR